MHELINHWQQLSTGRQQIIIALLVLGVLAFIAVIWALFIHTPSENRRSRGKARRETEPQRKRRKWKKQRREHRPRNPTLTETGGLPAPREHPTVGPIP